MIKRGVVLFLVLFFAIVILSNNVLANGISIISNNIVINKTYGTDTHFVLSIKNDEPFNFTNVTLENNNYIEFSKIPKLLSGETRNISVLVKANEDFSGNIKIYGFINASLGKSDNPYDIDITYESGPSKCDFSIIEGDKIIWKNLAVGDAYNVDLKAIGATSPFQQIPAGGSTEPQLFDVATTLYYTALFPQRPYTTFNCKLEIKNDYGYINLPKYDAILNINIDVQYPETSLETYFLNSNYTMEFYETKEDIFSIKNIGTKIAKDIHLSSDWITFSQNNFDLEPGQSKNIGYVIDPIIHNSTETDKTYTKKITITGNFNTIEKNIRVFIKYAEFVTEQQNNTAVFKDWLCANFPEFCEPQIIYKYIDNDEAEFNVSYTENQVKSLYDLFFNFLDAQAIKDKQSVESGDSIDKRLLKIETSTNSTSDDIANIDERIDTANGAWMFAAWIVGMVVSGIILFFLIMKYKDKYRSNIYSRYG